MLGQHCLHLQVFIRRPLSSAMGRGSQVGDILDLFHDTDNDNTRLQFSPFVENIEMVWPEKS